VGTAGQAVVRGDGGAGVGSVRVIEPSLDLTQLPNAASSSIERIDLDGNGRTLRLNALEVINITGQDNIYNTTTGFTAVTAVGWGALQRGNQLLVDGDATNGLSMPGNWSNLGTVQNTTGGVTRTYKVLQSDSAAAQVLVDDRVALSLVPTLMTGANELAGGLNLPEAQSSGGTPMRVNLADTGAAAGNVIRLSYNGVNYDVTLQPGDLTAGFVDIPVPTAALTAAVPAGSSGTVAATVTLLNAGTVLSASDPTLVTSNFIQPQAPIISASTWSSSGTSSLTGIPEALKNARHTSFTATTASGAADDNTLYFSEVNNSLDAGTWVRVQIPTTGTTGATAPALAGDRVVINWGSQSSAVSATLSATDINNKYVDLLVPWSAIQTQSWGSVSVSAQVVNAAGNASAASAVDVNYGFDLPLVNTGSS